MTVVETSLNKKILPELESEYQCLSTKKDYRYKNIHKFLMVADNVRVREKWN